MNDATVRRRSALLEHNEFKINPPSRTFFLTPPPPGGVGPTPRARVRGGMLLKFNLKFPPPPPPSLFPPGGGRAAVRFDPPLKKYSSLDILRRRILWTKRPNTASAPPSHRQAIERARALPRAARRKPGSKPAASGQRRGDPFAGAQRQRARPHHRRRRAAARASARGSFSITSRAGSLPRMADPKGWPTIFAQLPKNLTRLISIGRLDFNTEGLLLLPTTRARPRAELPSTGWLRATACAPTAR